MDKVQRSITCDDYRVELFRISVCDGGVAFLTTLLLALSKEEIKSFHDILIWCLILYFSSFVGIKSN
jgi:hypothetical protein